MMSSNQLKVAPVADAISLAELMHRIARELRIGASIADDCQDALGDDERLDIQPETAVRLQGLDLLSQQLVELGKVLDRLASNGVEGETDCSILDAICLTDLQQRLAGLATGVRVVDPELW